MDALRPSRKTGGLAARFCGWKLLAFFIRVDLTWFSWAQGPPHCADSPSSPQIICPPPIDNGNTASLPSMVHCSPEKVLFLCWAFLCWSWLYTAPSPQYIWGRKVPLSLEKYLKFLIVGRVLEDDCFAEERSVKSVKDIPSLLQCFVVVVLISNNNAKT